MKAILMSIRPEWVAKILNGEKTIEIRKKFPSDYVGWVYIYCTKNGHLTKCSNGIWYSSKHGKPYDSRFSYYSGYEGKVVARFWCDKVEEMYYCDEQYLKPSCLSIHEMFDYLKDKTGYAINITKVDPFDKPKEISEFYKLGAWKVYEEQLDSSYMKRTEQEIMKSLGQVLTRAPQSFMFIEV